mgnify:CR=1 FL=1
MGLEIAALSFPPPPFPLVSARMCEHQTCSPVSVACSTPLRDAICIIHHTDTSLTQRTCHRSGHLLTVCL